MNTTVAPNIATHFNYLGAEKIIRALDSQLRLRIIFILTESPRCVHELVGKLGSSQPLISQHLKVLRTAGIVDSERKGREIFYSLAMPEVVPIVQAASTLGS